jgi:bifunctional non-homologous end joining protein LigD
MRMTVLVVALIKPMLAAAGMLPAGPLWAFEYKWDGVRALAYVSAGQVRLYSRNGNDVTDAYPESAELVSLLAGRDAVLDGEIVALEDGDRPSFARLQQRIHNFRPAAALLASHPVRYYAFDLLELDGDSMIALPYEERRAALADLSLSGDHVRTPPHFTGVDGPAVLAAAERAGLEGVVAKRLGSPYRPGRRSPDWTKVPLVKTQEVIVIGSKPGSGRRAGTIGSLLVAVFDERDRLVFAGHVGSGFTDAALRSLETQLGRLTRSTPPATDVPREYARFARWVEPVLVGEVAFRNWTPDGRLRHPSWRGLRADRSPTAARRSPLPLPGDVEGALQTPDGRWRVEIVRRGRDRFYRLVNADNVVDGLHIASVERLLAEAGVDLADLVEIRPGGA